MKWDRPIALPSPERRWTLAALLLAILALGPLGPAGCGGRPRELRIGSKAFTESVILGEILTGLVRSSGRPAIHRRQLGGTEILWNALLAGEIDAYPEYTGTLTGEVLGGRGITSEAALAEELARRGVRMSRSLGFNDTYAIGMKEELAARLGIRTLSDLARHPELRLGFSHEFMNRSDGWPGLQARYGLMPAEVKGLDHDLAYRGLASGAIAATDLYSTDAEIRYYHLRVLEDDRGYFPAYHAVLLYRAELAERAPEALAALARLAGRIDEHAMVEMNARVKLDHVPEAEVAADFLARSFGLGRPARRGGERLAELLGHTVHHLELVALSLACAIALAIPLGVFAARRPRVGQLLLGAVSVVQTIPSLALLVFMIPLLGIGAGPAVAALVLYSLLPIVRNTHAGLTGIPGALREAAEALGLPPWARLWRIELPLAAPTILAGIKTAAVINVGTATLGALIGAGGLGQPILTGIRLDDTPLVLAGAGAAAALALAVQGLFELAERWLGRRR